jgi:hypothetical protein
MTDLAGATALHDARPTLPFAAWRTPDGKVWLATYELTDVPTRVVEVRPTDAVELRPRVKPLHPDRPADARVKAIYEVLVKRPDGQTALPAFRLGGVKPEDAEAARKAAQGVIDAVLAGRGGAV